MQKYINKRCIEGYVKLNPVRGAYPTREWVEWSLRPHSEDEIRERVLNDRDSVCYTYLCKNSMLSENFIIELALLSLDNSITKDNYDDKMKNLIPIFDENYDNRLDWLEISTYQKLSLDFIEKYKNLLDGDAITKNQQLNEQFIKDNLFSFVNIHSAISFQKVSKEFKFILRKIVKEMSKYIDAINENNQEYIDKVWSTEYIEQGEEDYEG